MGPWFLALGLSVSFAAGGTVLTFALLNLQLDPEFFRYIAAFLLLLIAAALLIKPFGNWLTLKLSGLTARFNTGGVEASSAVGQFGVGALLGLVWLPCVGPTLGAAIALASLGQDMAMAFVVMMSFGLGTASVLLFAAFASGRVLQKWRPGLLNRAEFGKKLLGWTLLLLALLVLSGVDKVLEAWALRVLPDWAISL